MHNYEVISQWDLGEFLNYDLVKETKPKSLFDQLRYPRCRWFEGAWGHEPVIVPIDDCHAEAFVHCDRQRALAIKHWFDQRKPDVCSGFD